MLHAVGSFAAGSFYAPLRKVRQWAWESFWLVMGIAAWIVAPWTVAALTTPELLYVLQSSPTKALLLAAMFGLLWGVGGLTFGLSVRYLGMALGFSVALGFCMTFGTLIPPIVDMRFGEIIATTAGQVVLVGVAICLAGIAVCGMAGVHRERELAATENEEQAPEDGNSELTIGKGFLVATISGILSACFAFGLAFGKPIAERAVAMGTQELYSNNAVLVVILIGGFTTNALWCLALNIRNRTFGDYVSGPVGRQTRNYCLSALGGFIWYAQFFFYGMGTTKLGKHDFSSWSIHMGLIIVFSNLWGLYFHEWRGVSQQTKLLVWGGILLLIASTMIIGFGNSLSG
ncbi:MAG: L-rhamnose/proton symporter RhaT [Pirellulales bacterium]|nr:L-rhamnose/proton symporter RhaT [Pirellulales bacterium]